jgi:hypothetical protein
MAGPSDNHDEIEKKYNFGMGGGVPQLWDKGGTQRDGSEHGGPQVSGVQDPNGVGNPDRGAEGDHVGGGLQAELEG